MPKITIMRADNAVYVDGRAIEIDCNELPKFIHAIQWDGAKGQIEFDPDERGVRMSNVAFTDISPFMYLVDRWNEIRDKQREEEEAMRKKNEEEAAKRREADEAKRNERNM
jgi:hypothetical protein